MDNTLIYSAEVHNTKNPCIESTAAAVLFLCENKENAWDF